MRGDYGMGIGLILVTWLIMIPLAVWKIVDIIIWIVSSVRITIV